MSNPSLAPSSSSITSSASTPTTSTSTTTTTLAGAGAPSSVSLGSFPNVPSASLSSTLEALRGLVGKRINAWTYLQQAGQGRVYWFNTVLLTTDDMRHAFPNDKMRARTTRFAVLGMSLSPLLEIQPPHDFLRGLLSLVQEFDGIAEDRWAGLGQGGQGLKGPSQRSLFKLSTSRSKKNGGPSPSSSSSTTNSAASSSGPNLSSVGSGTGPHGGGVASGTASSGTGGGGVGGVNGPGSGGAGGTSGPGGLGLVAPASGGGGGGAEWTTGFMGFAGGDGGDLFVPNIPFELDYFQVLTATCELVVQVYAKILSYLGPPPPSSSSTTSFPSALASHASNSYATSLEYGGATRGAGQAGGGPGGGGGGSSRGGGATIGATALSQGLAEVVVKVDSRLKKLISLLSKEMDQLARTAIKHELDVLGSTVEGWGGRDEMVV
ncbi:hypothetical protein JCM10212_005351 [Sporobolomyces blumeae]